MEADKRVRRGPNQADQFTKYSGVVSIAATIFSISVAALVQMSTYADGVGSNMVAATRTWTNKYLPALIAAAPVSSKFIHVGNYNCNRNWGFAYCCILSSGDGHQQNTI